MAKAERTLRTLSGAPALFALTIFWGASLVFVVQPLVGRLLLPSMGGTSVVWNICLVFFQGVLLAGYLYAHILSSRMSLRWQMVIHAIVFGAALFILPISFDGRPPPNSQEPVFWLLESLGTRVALPFFFISATAPLFQGWYARAGLPSAEDPYFLYAASNMGSMLALVSYPLLIEPSIALPAQSWGWWLGFMGFGVIGATTAWVAYKRARDETGRLDPFSAKRNESPSRKRIAWWVLCGFLPSALLVSVTTYLTTDVSSLPLLWIVPLALYLLSFIIVFGRSSREDALHRVLVVILPGLVLPLSLLWLTDTALPSLILHFVLHLVVFFVVCLVFHGELVRTRPKVDSSTNFYLWMSFGGVLGGAFSALLAPALFDIVMEYPLLLAASVLCLPALILGDEVPRWSKLVSLALGVTLAVLPWIREENDAVALVASVMSLLVGGLVWGILRRPRIFSAIFFIAVLVGLWHVRQGEAIVLRDRSYFAAYRVVENPKTDQRKLYHGRIVHGAQPMSTARQAEPTTYYNTRSGISQMLKTMASSRRPRVAVVGLGVGALAAYSELTEEMIFYEIDPLMVEIAREQFSYLDQCGDRCEVVVGDGRLALQVAEGGAYDLIVLDAYSSDAIPLHLLTREALELYASKMSENGVLAFHVTNRHLDLVPVIANLADDAGMKSLVYKHEINDAEKRRGYESSDWIFLSREAKRLAPMHALESARVIAPNGDRVWTDNFANILDAYKW